MTKHKSREIKVAASGNCVKENICIYLAYFTAAMVRLIFAILSDYEISERSELIFGAKIQISTPIYKVLR